MPDRGSSTYDDIRYYLSSLALLLLGVSLIGTDVTVGGFGLRQSVFLGATLAVSGALLVLARLLRR